jgi:hypothetical protein
MLLTVGIIDTARLFAADVSLTNGVREAALFAAGGGYGDAAGIKNRIDGEAAGMDETKIVIATPLCDNGSCNGSSNKVTISATYPFEPLTPIISVIMGNPIMIGASTTAQIVK